MTKTCPICQHEFIVSNKKPSQTYCSRACWKKSRLRQVECVCETCGKTFSIYQARNNARFCSFACRKNHIAKVCCYCGNTFYVKASAVPKRTTCSRRCAALLRSQEGRGSRPIGHAVSQTTRQKVSAGLRKYYNGDPTKHWNFQGGAFTQQRGSSWKSQKEAARLRDGYACRLCGISETKLGKKLSIHHLVSFRNFASHTEANQLTNLISVCQSCHMKLEHGTATPPPELFLTQ